MAEPNTPKLVEAQHVYASLKAAALTGRAHKRAHDEAWDAFDRMIAAHDQEVREKVAREIERSQRDPGTSLTREAYFKGKASAARIAHASA